MSSPAYADETFLKYYVSTVGSPSESKGLSFGRQSELWIFEGKWEAGFYTDNTNRPGAEGSAYGFVGIGIEPTAGSFYVNFFQSVGGITNPDSVLGGHFQFQEEVGFGIKDQEKGVSFGPFYKHISSAGINRPNKGRDFVGFQVRLPF